MERHFERTGRTLSRPVAAMIVLLLIGGWGMHAQAPAKDFDKWWTPQNEALVAAPQHHTLLFENEEVRVLLVEYLADGTTIDRGTRNQGGARWLPIGAPHALENVGATPLRIVRVELKNARSAAQGFPKFIRSVCRRCLRGWAGSTTDTRTRR